MGSNWLENKRNQKEPIRLELVYRKILAEDWEINAKKIWPGFSANNDLALQVKRQQNS